MKFLIMSDLHGGAKEAEIILDNFNKLACDAIILLGDLLNHGPRNNIPKTYNPSELATLLNQYSDKIIAIRGNCDSEVDSMLFNFPCNAPYSYIFAKKDNKVQKIFLTHGHLFDIDDLNVVKKIGLKKGDIVLSGHTHIQGIFKLDTGVININPGSTTIAKGGTKKGFAIMDDTGVFLYDIDANLIGSHLFFD